MSDEKYDNTPASDIDKPVSPLAHDNTDDDFDPFLAIKDEQLRSKLRDLTAFAKNATGIADRQRPTLQGLIAAVLAHAIDLNLSKESAHLMDAAGPFSCLSKLKANEPYFVLRAQDIFAPTMVRMWVGLAAPISLASDKRDEALKIASDMEQWPYRKYPT